MKRLLLNPLKRCFRVVDRIEMIRERLQNALQPVMLEITDESSQHIGHPGAAAGGGHFNVKIVSDQFERKSTIERHRMVYQAVHDLMPREIHALSIHASSPTEN